MSPEEIRQSEYTLHDTTRFKVEVEVEKVAILAEIRDALQVLATKAQSEMDRIKIEQEVTSRRAEEGLGKRTSFKDLHISDH